ncbi:putative toxin [Sphingomonas adhaesiva]|uniref:putative toxin n=1 Tax=Sphingomonas adhaesiva TaxID=28212 RepID=UPI002FF523B1
MVGIFTGAGFGLGRGSASTLGAPGLLGDASQGGSGDQISVNAATGNLLIQKQDEFLVGRGPDASVSRSYNSLTTLQDDNNDRWRQSTDRRVTNLTGTVNAAGSTVARVSGDGSYLTYVWDAGRSAYLNQDGGGAYDTITRNGNEWVWTDGDTRTVERYADDAAGRIKSVTDHVGTTMAFAYDAGGRLYTVTTSDGSWIRYDWVGSTQNVAQIVNGFTDFSNNVARTITRTRYGYDAANRLTTVTVDLSPQNNSISDGKTYVTTYGYDAGGRVSSIAQSDGSAMSVAYDASGRVVTLVQTASSSVTRTTSLAYNSGYTLVTDATGQVTRLDYNGTGDLTKITAPPAAGGVAAQVWQFAYNAAGDVTSTTDPLGQATTYADFTANGIAQTVTDRTGATTTRTFDAANHLLSETRSGIDATGASVQQTTRYVYNAAGDLRFVITPAGLVTEYVRNGYGAITSEIRYNEGVYDTAGTPTEAVMAGWAGGAWDKSGVQRTDHMYDARLQRIRSTSYATASADGAGQTTDIAGEVNYIYDQAGNLLWTQAPGRGQTTYVYDGLGRMTATSDAAGQWTSLSINDAANRTAVMVADGTTTIRTYNRAGDLLQEAASGANATTTTTYYAVDKLGRRRITSFSAVERLYELYDAAGRHVATVDISGRITEYRYDGNNRLVGTIDYRNAISASYITTLDNPDNTLTIATIRPAAHAEDVSSWTVYDGEGRVLQTIAGDGSTTISTYDAAGRLQKTTAFVTKIASATVAGFVAAAPTAVITPAAAAGDLSKRWFYDRDGRVIGTLDGANYVVRHRYDQVGQLVATTAFANATAAGNPATASFDAILAGITTSAQDRTTRSVYDGRGQRRFAIDALGNTTRFDYDATGLVTRTAQYATPLGTLADYTFDHVLSQVSAQEADAAKRVSYAVYDGAGRLAYKLSPLQGAGDMAVTRHVYDLRGNVVRTTAFAATRATPGLPDKATMDSWATSAASADDRVTRMWYTGRDQLAYRVDAEGNVTKFDYDGRGRGSGETVWENPISVGDGTTLAQVAAAVGGTSYTVSRTYDNLNRVRRTYDATGSYTDYVYLGTTELVSSSTRAAGGTAQEQSTRATTFDGAGRVIQETDGSGTGEASTRWTRYDGRGLVSSTKDARYFDTTYAYDLNGRLKTTTNVYGMTTSQEYNAFGEVWKATDRRGAVSYSWYDRAGRITATRDAGDYLTTTTYTAFGDVAAVGRWVDPLTGTASMSTEPGGTGAVATTRFTYDKAGRVLTSTDALGATERYAYNNFGDRISVSNRLWALTTSAFDRLGRITRQSGVAATINIDAAGNETTGAQNVKTFAYDSRDNTKTVIEGYSASEGGPVTALRTTSHAYDAASRLIRTTHDSMTVIADDMVTTSTVTPVEDFVYDVRGNVIKSVDKSGAQTFSYYDDLDRRTVEIRQTSASTAVYTAFVYDKNGNVVTTRVYDANAALPGTAGGTEPAAPSGTYRQTDFGYDNLNRLASRTVVSVPGNTIASGSWNGSAYTQTAGNLVTRYNYDNADNLTRVTDPNGAMTTNWYDLAGRKVGSIDGEGYGTRWTYNAEGLVLSEVRFANKFTGTVQLWSMPYIGPNAADRTTLYTYDLNGNRLSEKRTNVVAFNVDAQSGALSAAGTDAVVTYTYNALGQVSTKRVDGQQVAAFFYDEGGRLFYESKGYFDDVNLSHVAPGTAYEYDALGNVTLSTRSGSHHTNVSVADRVTTYRFATGGHLAAMIDAEGFAHQYSYDAAGRLKKDAYNRLVNADANASSGATTTIAEAKTSTYDLAGRVLSQSVYSTVGGTFKRIGVTNYQYDNFDQVTQQGIGTNSASDIAAGSALYQIANQYDGAGRLVGTNSGDGVWKFFGYDAAGNRTAAVTSAGASFSAATGFATALSQAGNANVNATYTTYDRRNLATTVIEEGRDLSAAVTGQTLTTSRSYNGFGDVVAETDALGNTITYTYNAMGRRTRTEGPGVQITNENGGTNWIRPSDDSYYDLGGRLIATRDANGSYGAGSEAAPASKAANTGNLTTYALLAGTGYDGSASRVSIEFHADGGRKQTLYDRMGDARVIRDELYSSGAPNLHVTEQTFDRLGNLIEVKHNRATNVADDSSRLIDTYGYDQFGQRLLHRTNANAGWVYEKNDYDGLGRASRQVDFSGYATTTAYDWDGTLATGGMGTFGGFVTTTTVANGRTSVVKNDIFNHETFRKDLGNHQSVASYDAAGRQITRGDYSYGWFNTGLVATVGAVTSGSINTDDWTRQTTTYGYDKVGRRVREKLAMDGQYGQQQWDGYDYYWTTVPFSYQITDQTATYDALGRLRTMNAAATTFAPAADIARAYDAAGNIRSTVSTHAVLDQNGAVTSNVTDTFWYRYDSMNRLVTDRGMLSGAAGATDTTIVRTVSNSTAGANATPSNDYVYDLAGQRIAAIRTEYGPPTYISTVGVWVPGGQREAREIYGYDGAGRIATLGATLGATNSSNSSSPPPAGPATGGTILSTFGYDLLGRQTAQNDYQNGNTIVFSRSATYAANGALLSETTNTTRNDGATYRTESSYSYHQASDGSYLLGAIGSVTTNNFKNNGYQSSTSTINSYEWWDGAVQRAISYRPNTSSSTTYTTTFTIDRLGRLASATTDDARRRSVVYRANAEGQVIQRQEYDNNSSAGDPHEVWYRFAGVELGYVGNNGTTRISTAESIANRRVEPGSGPFRYGATTGSAYSDFSQSPDVINAYEQGSAAGGFTARAGDTLRSVAQQLWGDSGLWYKLAEANGIQGDMALAEGQRLNVPPGVVRSGHNAATLRPYDAAEATGNLSPTQPQPSRRNGCGAFGQILLAAIAIAVTVIALPAGGLAAGLTGIGQGALAGAAGSVASQAVGLATGIQDKFDVKGLAMAAVGGGLSAGLGGLSGLDGLTKSGFLNNVARGAVGSALSQGVGLATGLQEQFSWAGVAAAGVGAGIGNAAFGKMGLTRITAEGGRSLANIAGNVLSGTASTLASAATRSALDGSSFGDNVLRGLPDVIGSTIGELVKEKIIGAPNSALKGPRSEADATDRDATDRASADAAQASARGAADNGIGNIGGGAGGTVGGGNPLSPTNSGVAGDRDEAIVVIARRDTQSAIRYENGRGNFDTIHDQALSQGLDSPEEGDLFRIRALENQILTPLRNAESFVLDNLPVIGTGKSLAQIYTGTDLLTQQPVDRLLETGTLALSFVPFGKMAEKGLARFGISQLGKAAETATARAARLGLEGEQAIGITGPKVGIRIPGSNRLRFPDAVDLDARTLTEVKNVGYQGYTRQLRDYVTYAQDKNLTFNLYVRDATSPLGQTRLSTPLADAVRRGEIVLKSIPGK